MKYFFDQHYKCGDAQFYNIFQAFEEQKKTKHLPLYYIDADFIKNLQNTKRPKNLSPKYLQTLMINRLKDIRKKTKKLKLLYTGGTDSHTILRLCIENDIYLDEVATHLVSITNDIKTDIEYIPGLRYAEKFEKTIIGKVNKIHPTLDDMIRKLESDDWYMDPHLLPGRYIHLRPYSLSVIIKENLALDDDTIVLLGDDKPSFKIENGTIFWTRPDTGYAEAMGIKQTIPFFFDKDNTELTVGMSYAFLDCFQSEDLKKDQFIEAQSIKDRKFKQKVLHNIGLYSTGRGFLDNHLLGKKDFLGNIKTRRFLKELEASSRPDLVERLFSVYDRVYNKYKHLPYAMEKHGKYCSVVGRYSQKVPILQDKFGS